MTATIQEASTDLCGLLRRLQPGEEVTLTDNGAEVATLRAALPAPVGKRVPGLWIGKATVVSDDDDHLDGRA